MALYATFWVYLFFVSSPLTSFSLDFGVIDITDPSIKSLQDAILNLFDMTATGLTTIEGFIRNVLFVLFLHCIVIIVVMIAMIIKESKKLARGEMLEAQKEPTKVIEEPRMKPVERTLVCPSCGAEQLDKTSAFCSKCGAPVK